MSHFSTCERWCPEASLSRVRSKHFPRIQPLQVTAPQPSSQNLRPSAPLEEPALTSSFGDAVECGLVLTLQTTCLCSPWPALDPVSEAAMVSKPPSFLTFDTICQTLPQSTATWSLGPEAPVSTEAWLEMSHYLTPCFCHLGITSIAGVYAFLRGAENVTTKNSNNKFICF